MRDALRGRIIDMQEEKDPQKKEAIKKEINKRLEELQNLDGRNVASVQSNNQTEARGFSYYQNLRRKDSWLYYTAAVQNEMARAREALGADEFYKK